MLQQDQFPFSSNNNPEKGSSFVGTLFLLGSIIVTFLLVNKIAITDSSFTRQSKD